ncbi:MAG: leucine-rich repeat domain-containing protein [Planctomycetaceae bacterium]
MTVETTATRCNEVQTSSWMAKNLRWLWALCLATVVLAIVLVGGPALRQHFVLEAFRASGDGFGTHPIGPHWMRKWIGVARMQSVEAIESVHLSASSIPLIIDNPDLFARVHFVSVETLPRSTEAVTRLFGDTQTAALLPNVRHVMATGGPFSDSDMSLLDRCRSLEHLALLNTAISNASLAHIGQHSKLRILEIGFNTIDDSEFHRLAPLLELRVLNLSDTQVGDDSTKTIARFLQLEHLQLGTTAVTDAGLAELVSLRSLKALRIGNPDVTDAGMKSIAQLESLEFLSLENTTITGAGLGVLATLPNLTEVYIYGNSITSVDIAEFDRLRKSAGLSLCIVRNFRTEK